MHKVLKLAFALAIAPALLLALGAALVLGAATPSLAHASATPIHHSVPRIGARNGRHSTSTNWSGYVTTGARYTSVSGTWTEPSATCAAGQTAYSSFWVGIDGDTTNTVEQTGTDADCSSGTPTYYAWYEMYPKYPVNLSYTVRPGDTVSASVTTDGAGHFTLTITDGTRGWSYTTHQYLKKARLGSAEWIAEAPSSSSGVLPLADFGTVAFSRCYANGASISANPSPDEIVMVTSAGTVKAQPSALSSSGTAFSVAWKHS